MALINYSGGAYDAQMRTINTGRPESVVTEVDVTTTYGGSARVPVEELITEPLMEWTVNDLTIVTERGSKLATVTAYHVNADVVALRAMAATLLRIAESMAEYS